MVNFKFLESIWSWLVISRCPLVTPKLMYLSSKKYTLFTYITENTWIFRDPRYFAISTASNYVMISPQVYWKRKIYHNHRWQITLSNVIWRNCSRKQRGKKARESNKLSFLRSSIFKRFNCLLDAFVLNY